MALFETSESVYVDSTCPLKRKRRQRENSNAAKHSALLQHGRAAGLSPNVLLPVPLCLSHCSRLTVLFSHCPGLPVPTMSFPHCPGLPVSTGPLCFQDQLLLVSRIPN
ncbi:unnamed protein product [Gadus morhua 'NCC']